MKDTVVTNPQRSLKRVCTDVLLTTARDLQDCYREEELGVSLPTFDSVSTVLQQARSVVRPPLPISRSDISLKQGYRMPTDGRKFLIIDDGVPDRILGLET